MTSSKITETSLPDPNPTYPDNYGLKTVSGGIQPDVTAHVHPMSMGYRDKVSWWAVFYRSVPDAIGIGGVKYAFNPAEVRWRRLFWLLLILAGLSLLLFHVINRAQHLSTHPTSVDVYTNYTGSLPFPTVAICNYNAFKYSLVAGTELEAFLNDYSNSFSVNGSSPHSTFFDSMTMSDLFIDYGHTVYESISFGTWKILTGVSHANFTAKITDWGLCFVFNDADSGNPPLTVNRPGRSHGLDLTLNVQRDEDFLEPANRLSTGFQILLYDYGTEPLLEDQGFGIAPGTHTQVGVEVHETSNLEPPYGLCEDKTLKYFENYGYPECFIECRTDYFKEVCGCKYYAAATGLDNEECTAWNFFSCGQEFYDAFITNLTCDCPVPCNIRSYEPFISTTSYPSPYWESKISAAFGFALPDGYIKDNFCSISIYFKELSIQQVTQNVDYNFFSFLCDIGGSLGLWLGGSILTFFELLDLLGHSIFLYSKRVPNAKK